MTREEALDRMKRLDLNSVDREALYTIIPELRESDDERIRKTLLELAKKHLVNHERCMAESWLEKHKEEKPIEDVVKDITKNRESATKFLKSAGIMDDNGELAEMYRLESKPAKWSEKDKTMLNNLIWAVHMKSISPLDEMDDRGKYERYEKFLTSLPERFGLKPEREWSEEDDATIKSAVHWLEKYLSTIRAKDVSSATQDGILTVKTTITNLKSLPSSWKPSEEQLEALLNILHPDDPYYYALKSLYEQLKKL